MFKFYNDTKHIEQKFKDINGLDVNQIIPVVFIWHWTDAIKYSYIFGVWVFDILYRHLRTEVSGTAYYKDNIFEPNNFIVIYGKTKLRHAGRCKIKRILLRVVLHEVRHQYQNIAMKDWFNTVSKNEHERDAHEYANEIIDK